ncbi:hypothetical protein BC629DRAFT_1550831 [Irpex lacteus]|nr:hypothetical protein BC629DRAFT_1550831 [Irpex lacteus]
MWYAWACPLSSAVGGVGSFFPRAHCITVECARAVCQRLWTSEFQSPDGGGTRCTASHGRGVDFLSFSESASRTRPLLTAHKTERK